MTRAWTRNVAVGDLVFDNKSNARERLWVITALDPADGHATIRRVIGTKVDEGHPERQVPADKIRRKLLWWPQGKISKFDSPVTPAQPPPDPASRS